MTSILLPDSTKPAIQHQLMDTLPGVELVRAYYQGFEFEPHVHEDFHIGICDFGAQDFMHKGSRYVLAPQRLSLINPDDVHDGKGAVTGNYQVRCLRVSADCIARVAELQGQPNRKIFFRGPDIADPFLYNGLLQLHRAMERPGVEPLATDTQLMLVLSHLIQRYADSPQGESERSGKGSKQFSTLQRQQLKDYLLADICNKHRLADLAALFNLSEYQFLRRFRQSIGMTPHAYLLALRVDCARRSLMQGKTVSEAAVEAGFYDQSHLVHAFKRRYDLTPSAYQQQVWR
ncbi:AraC family transcriptional regulator [Pokkaliibacter plantistimulans]|nr:AraC family transcriptional regulator [Pokkaliibacter plantistimulans]